MAYQDNFLIENHLLPIIKHPLVQGSVIGSFTMWSVTPLNNWTNCALKGVKMPLSRAMTGAGQYATAAVPGYATAFFLHNALGGHNPDASITERLKATFLSGMGSGWISTPFESLAQNKQLGPYKTTTATLSAMVKSNGFNSLFRGALSIMLRQGAWVTAYFGGAPIISNYCKEKGVNRWASDAIGVTLSAGSFGAFSAPFQQIRFRKQLDLTQPTKDQSYITHIKNIANQNPQASIGQRFGSFFKAIGPRTAAVTAAAAILFEGNELIDALHLKTR